MNIAKKPQLKEIILEKISDYDIFQYYLGNFKIGKCIRSPFMKDEHPSLLIGVSKGALFYRDMRGGDYHGDCFRLVMQLYSLDFVGALNKIGQDFGILDGSDRFQMIRAREKPILHKVKKKFEVISRPFTEEELKWWNRGTISKEELERDLVYSIKSAFIDGKKVRIEKDELAFAYYFADVDCWKLYFPNREKGKWFTNLDGNSYVEGKKNLIGAKKAILTKSRKDRLLLSKFLPTANTQNESRSAFTPEFVSFLDEHVETLYLNFDNDKTGTENSLSITKEFGYKYVNAPKYLLKQGITDFFDWAAADGIDVVENYLKKKKII